MIIKYYIYGKFKNSSELIFLFEDFLELPKTNTQPFIEAIYFFKPYTNFKKISSTDIKALRRLLKFYPNSGILIQWAFKLLRYVEVNYTKLRTKEKESKRTKQESIHLFNQLYALFVDYYLVKKDIIFFNTALKMYDLKWIRANSIELKTLHAVKSLQVEKILIILANE